MKLRENSSVIFKLGVVVLFLSFFAVMSCAEVYEPYVATWTSSAYPVNACLNSPPTYLDDGGFAGNFVAGGPVCKDIPGRGFLYYRFNVTIPARSVSFVCLQASYQHTLNSTPLLFRVFYEFNESGLTYSNQRSYCSLNECWNVYGGVSSNVSLRSESLSTSNYIGWDLNSMYGFGHGSYADVSLFFADTNTSSDSLSYFHIGNCELVTSGYIETCDLRFYVRDGGGIPIQNLLLRLDKSDYSAYTSRITDAAGYASFTVPRDGSYRLSINDQRLGIEYSGSYSCTAELYQQYILRFDAAKTASVSGYVYWPNGTGASYAGVNLDKYGPGNDTQSTVTDLTGFYNFSGVTKSNYTIQAFKLGYYSNIESFSCVGDDSVNLILQSILMPPDGYAYTYVNVTVFSGVTTRLSGATVQRWSYDSSSCPLYCFADSACRNTNCGYDRYVINVDDRTTDSNGVAEINHLSPRIPIPTKFYIYAFKNGYLDNFQLVTVTGDYTPVYLYLSINPNTTVNLHETNNLSGVLVKVTPNLGASQQGYTNSTGDVQFTFTSVISSLIVNATTTNPYYMNKNFIFSSLAGNPIYKDFTLPNRNITSFNLYGFCIDNVGNPVDGVTIELGCSQCSGKPGNSVYCDEYLTQGGGLYYFGNIIKSTYCYLTATDYPGGYAYSEGGRLTFYPTPGDNYYNLTNCARSIGQNITPGTIYLKGNVIEGVGRKQSGLTIPSGPFRYSINDSGYVDGRVSNGILYIDHLGYFSNVTIKFNIPDYEKRIFRIGMGNNNYEHTFILDWIGVEETSTTQSTTTFPTVVTTTTTKVTTTLVVLDWDNYTLYTPKNETISLFENTYLLIITVASSIIGFTLTISTLIILFVGVCVLLLGNQVLRALGFKWSWFGL